MGIFGGLFGGNKDTAVHLDTSGMDNAIKELRKYGQDPTELQRSAKQQQGIFANDQRLGESDARKQTGASRIHGGNQIASNMANNNLASYGNSGKYGAMATSLGDRNIQKQSNDAYNVMTRILPNYNYKKAGIETGATLADMQADAQSRANNMNMISDVIGMGTQLYSINSGAKNSNPKIPTANSMVQVDSGKAGLGYRGPRLTPS